MAEVIYFFSLLWYNTHGPIRGLAAYSVYLLFSQQILRFAGIACSYHALRKKISALQLLSSPANMVQYPRTYPWVSRLQRLSAVLTANSTIRRYSLLIPCLAEENICFAAAFFPCKHGKIPLGNHQRKDEGSSYGNYPAKGAIYHFTAACVDCGVVFGHCLRLRHTASEKGAGHPRLVPCVCLLSVSDFPSDEGTYHSRMRVRPFRRSFFITKICLTESAYTCSIKEKDYSCRLEGGTGYGL